MALTKQQKQAMADQGFDKKPLPENCANCKHFACDRVQTQPPSYMSQGGWWEDKNLRCELGGFPVKKTSKCAKFERRLDDKP